MRLFVAPLLLAACSVVPVERGPTPLQSLEARLAVLDATLASREASLEALDARVQALEARSENAERSASRRRGAVCSLPHTEVAPIPEQRFIPFEGAFSDLSTEDVDTMGRALLHRDAHGNVDGYRLSAIRSDSLPYTLGLRSGDVVHRVNGMPLSSMEAALQAWVSAQDDEVLHVDLTRGETSVELTIHLSGKR